MGYSVNFFEYRNGTPNSAGSNFYFEELQYALDFIGTAIDHSSDDSLCVQICVVDEDVT